LSTQRGPAVVAVGGGHGLSVTLRACRPWAGQLTAVVSVADDGGSTGRIRAATGLPALGDVRRCLTTLADPAEATLAAALERRFDAGELAGHAAGNLLLAALAAEHGGDLAAAAAHVGRLLGLPECVRVVPVSTTPVELAGHLPGGTVVRGQVAVEEAGGVERVELDPAEAAASPSVLDAVASADLIVLGPGSLFGSVLAAAVVADLAAAIAAAPAPTAFVCNLRAQPPETEGYDVGDHVAALRRHGVTPDVVVVDPAGLPVGDPGGVAVVEAAVARDDGLAHDPDRLGAALRALLLSSEATGLGSA